MIKGTKNYLVELEKEQEQKSNITHELNERLIRMDDELIEKVLCEGCCKGREIKKLTDKCGNKEITRFLYQCEWDKIKWIPFDKFKNIILNI